MPFRPAALSYIAGLLALSATACATETIISDQVSTELTLVSPGGVGEDFEITKRFRFSRSPNQARGFEIQDGLVAVLSPVGYDLTFLHRISVFAVAPDGERVEIGRGQDFQPGDTWAVIEPVYEDDLREFASDDARLTLVFQIEPNAWFDEFPEEGITVLARANVDILL
jgi:hypothetical protein